MNNLNRVVLQGNLVRDVEVKYGSTSGKAFGSFCIAVNGSKKENFFRSLRSPYEKGNFRNR